MICIGICDDEKYMRCELEQKITCYGKKHGHSFQIVPFVSAEELLESKKKLDLIFLDIRLDGMDGMAAARRLKKKRAGCRIVFLTVLKDYVFDAFEVEAVNYLVKPVPDEKLFRTMDRVIGQITETKGQYFVICSGHTYRRIPLHKIYYIEVIKRKIYIHCDREVVEYYDSISNVEQKLPEYFFRCHRSFLVNLQQIRQFCDGNLMMENGEIVPVSRLRQKEFAGAALKYMQRGSVG